MTVTLQMVEQGMVMNVLVAEMEIPDEQLRALRGRYVQDVKTTYDGHLAERRNTALFSLNFLIPTTCHSKK